MNTQWQPTTSLKSLDLRAKLYQKIRTFFLERNVLEVETPLLCQHTVTDAHIDSFQIKNNPPYFLQTSPEYAMKRLLASGSGPIFQICKAFRQEESGHQHNPEFTMLEWYQLDYTHHDLMHEVDAFLQFTIDSTPAEKISYQDLFLKYLNFDPLKTDLKTCHDVIRKNNIDVDLTDIDLDTSLQILLSHLIEPQLGLEKPLFLYDFPPSQAALAKIRDDKVAERFEVYINGTEIANGFHELTDASEQRARFEKDREKRKAQKKFVPEIDPYFLDALKAGLPACSGVAVGVDRLLMQLTQTKNIQDVISFPWERA